MAAASEDKTWLELQTWRLLLWNIWYFQDYGTKQETCEDLMWLKTELGRNVLGFSFLSFLRCLYLSLKTGHGGSALAMFGRFCAVTSLQTFFFFFFQWNKCDSKKMTAMKAERRSWRQNVLQCVCVSVRGERGGKKKKLVFSHHRDVCLWREGAAVFNYGAIKKWNIF